MSNVTAIDDLAELPDPVMLIARRKRFVRLPPCFMVRVTVHALSPFGSGRWLHVMTSGKSQARRGVFEDIHGKGAGGTVVPEDMAPGSSMIHFRKGMSVAVSVERNFWKPAPELWDFEVTAVIELDLDGAALVSSQGIERHEIEVI